MNFDLSFADNATVLRKSDSLLGFTLVEADFPDMFQNGSDNYYVGSSSLTDPVDVEAITLEAMLELTEDPADLLSTSEPIDSTNFDPIPVQSFNPTIESNCRTLQENMQKRFIELPPTALQRPTKKVKRVVSTSSEASSTDGGRFRGYQADQWAERFEELCAFFKNHGHCQVPHSFVENEALARWTKRQR